MASPLITFAVPSYNQGRYLEAALASIFEQEVPVEVFVADAGSTDHSLDIIRSYENKLAGWRSYADRGQAAAINECIAQGRAPYVAWLNSDDLLLARGLKLLVETLEENTAAPAAYGRVWNLFETTGAKKPVWVEPFKETRLAKRCIISQPGVLIRRTAWDLVRGLDENLQAAMDYELWWRLYKTLGPLCFVDQFVAVNRDHPNTKTNTLRRLHYQEAIWVVHKYHGRVPCKWWLAQPYAIWLKTLLKNWP